MRVVKILSRIVKITKFIGYLRSVFKIFFASGNHIVVMSVDIHALYVRSDTVLISSEFQIGVAVVVLGLVPDASASVEAVSFKRIFQEFGVLLLDSL